MYQILLFYKYVFIENPEEVASWQRELQERFSLRGRTIVAKEGINVTLEGKKEDTENYIKEVEKDPRFQNIHWKKSEGTGRAFPKISVKVRPEIVALKLGVCDVDPNQVTGKRLKPEELHNWLNPPTGGSPDHSENGSGKKEGREFYVIDMRNIYEHKVGKFEGSICPPLKNFRDLPNIIDQISHLKEKTVLTVCTGGVRCEKASGFLITQGFKDVYQLDGGIVSYMEKYPNEDFKGKLYVFDNRKTMGFYTDDTSHEIIGACESCGKSCEQYTNCSDVECHAHFLCCKECLEKNGGKLSCPTGCHYDRSGNEIKKNIFVNIYKALKSKWKRT
ncbi:rhodanese domain-containing protein [Candidatus Nomurabacteria bacterium]|nr:rhodanese domain-containing protein [Candidatus Nomurabacteria bacterium]